MALETSGDGGATPAEGGIAQQRTGGAGAEVQASATGTRRHRYLGLVPLGVQDIPHHQDLEPAVSAQVALPELENFAKELLDEAKEWDISKWPQTGTHKFGKKSLAAGIEVTQHKKGNSDDIWFARYSKHPETAGSPSSDDAFAKLKRWEVFDHILRQDHSKHEAEYTPNVFDRDLVLKWAISAGTESRCGMKNMSLEIVNMYHGIPAPLYNRVFTVLVLSGVRTGLPQNNLKHESIIVQMPVDLSAFPEEVKKRCHYRLESRLTYRPPPECITEENRSKVGKGLVQGMYASVEKISSVEGVSHWAMATASDAKGNLPLRVQRMAVPGEIVKDVEYVYGYMEKRQEELLLLISAGRSEEGG